MNALTCWTLALFTLGLSVGCGSTDDSKDEVSACGGNLVGVWKVTSFELDSSKLWQSSGLPAECSKTVRTIDVPDPDLTFTFSADGNLKTQGKLSMRMHYEYDAACLQALMKSTPSAEMCASLQATLEQQVKQAHPDSSGSCSFVNGGCSCTALQHNVMDENKAYKLSAANILVGDQAFGEYCVQGDKLVIEREDASMELQRQP
jgi:hypothetical protein